MKVYREENRYRKVPVSQRHLYVKGATFEEQPFGDKSELLNLREKLMKRAKKCAILESQDDQATSTQDSERNLTIREAWSPLGEHEIPLSPTKNIMQGTASDDKCQKTCKIRFLSRETAVRKTNSEHLQAKMEELNIALKAMEDQKQATFSFNENPILPLSKYLYDDFRAQKQPSNPILSQNILNLRFPESTSFGHLDKWPYLLNTELYQQQPAMLSSANFLNPLLLLNLSQVNIHPFITLNKA